MPVLIGVVVAYIFWSIFTSLIPTLFYFSVWELAIAGSELALFSTLSPIWLSIPSLLRWVRTRGGQTTMQLLSFVGIAAYALESPLHRLFLVAFATSAAMIPQMVKWSDDPSYQSLSEIITCRFFCLLTGMTVTGLGLMLASLSKHCNHSNNPSTLLIHRTSFIRLTLSCSLALH